MGQADRVSRASLGLVGRDRELSLLGDLLDGVLRGTRQTAVIEGEPGIGKSRLVDAICERARSKGVTVWQATGEEFQTGRPFGVILSAVEGQLSRDEDRRGLAELSEETPAEFGADQRYRFAEAVEDALEHETHARPVLVAIDDAQWADAGSLLALQALSRRADLAVFLLLSCRFLPRSSELARLLAGLADTGASFLSLAPLDDQRVDELAAARLRSQPGEILRRQLRGSGGNPLFVLELLDGLVEEGMLNIGEDEADMPRSVRPPPSLRALIIRRLSFMSAASIDALRTASLLGDSFSAHDLASVMEVPLSTALEVLKEPITAGVIDATGDTFSFQHDVVREALYGDVAPAMRRGLHLHIGRTLAAAGASKIRVADQVLLGADRGDREAVGWIRDAAAEIAPRDPDLAVEFLEKASELLPVDDPERDGLLLEQVIRLMFAGRLERASEQADELRRRVAGTPLQAMVDTQRLGILALQLRADEMVRLSDEILQSDSLPEDFRAQALVTSAAGRLVGGDIAGTQFRMDEVREYVEANPLSTAAGLYMWLNAGMLLKTGRLTLAAEALERALPNTDMFVGGRGQGLNLVGYGYTLGTDDFDKARSFLEEGRVELERRGARSFIVEYHWLRANLDFYAGDWDDALVEMTAANDLGQETGTFGVAIGAAPDPTILIRLFRGDTAGAVEALSVVDRFQTGMFVTHWLEPIRALVQDAAGDRAGALERSRAWHRGMAENSFVPDLRTLGRLLVRLYREVGDQDLIAQLLAGAREARERADGLKSIEAATLLVEGTIEGDIDALLAAVDAASAAGRPFDLAETCAETGTGLLRRGDPARGRELAMEAWSIYEELGASRQEAALAQDLRDLGIRRGSRHKRGRPTLGWDSLTDSEQRIVGLVGEGLTNREIGERLFVSKGTVATHLRNIFRKLEVSSRTELAAEASRRSK